jgi:hypothetical protein
MLRCAQHDNGEVVGTRLRIVMLSANVAFGPFAYAKTSACPRSFKAQ